jgi:hypothetical protein
MADQAELTNGAVRLHIFSCNLPTAAHIPSPLRPLAFFAGRAAGVCHQWRPL